MVMSFESACSESVSFQEFVDHFERQGKNPISSNVDGAVEMMQRIYNNRGFLAEFIVDNQFSKIENEYTSEVLILHRSEHFLVRAVIWLPMRESASSEMNYFEDVHDHNFDFVTLGYLGNGYYTDVWEYDIQDIKGEVGERVDIKYKGRENLAPHRVLYFRKGVDIHQQIPPDEVSVSLNVLEANHEMQNQYFFDLEGIEKPVARISENINPPLVGLLARMMGHVGKGSKILEKLSQLDFREDKEFGKIRQEAINGLRRFSDCS